MYKEKSYIETLLAYDNSESYQLIRFRIRCFLYYKIKKFADPFRPKVQNLTIHKILCFNCSTDSRNQTESQ